MRSLLIALSLLFVPLLFVTSDLGALRGHVSNSVPGSPT